MKSFYLSILCFHIILFTPAIFQAQNFIVNTFDDTPDINLSDGICADASGECSLRAAVMESNALSGSHEVTLQVGVYLLSNSGINEDDGQTGDLDLSANISIVGMGPEQTFINGDSLDRILHIQSSGVVALEMLSLAQGYALSGNGGAILNQGALTLNNIHIANSSSELNQGGTGQGGMGGAILNQGILNATNSTFYENTAKGGSGIDGSNGGGGGGSTPGLGGAIFNASNGTISLINCTLSTNRAIGGRYSNGSANGGNFNMIGNPGAGLNGGPPGASGGGAGGDATGDFSGGGGGGSSSSFGGLGGLGGYGGGGGGRGARSGSGSSGPGGLGGFAGGQGSGPCCSSGGGGGAGGGLGGAIFNNGGSIVMTNCTVAFNEAIGGQGRSDNPNSGYAAGGTDGEGYGGGLFNRVGNFELNNTIVSQNSITNEIVNAAPQGVIQNEDLFGEFQSIAGHNLIYELGTASFSGSNQGLILSVDPTLGELNNYGGPTYTHSIPSCPVGPASNVGNDAYALQYDQRGFERSGISDIGAFESQSTAVSLDVLITKPCQGASNGAIVLIPSGTPEYTYEWDSATGGQTDSIVLNLSVGTYSVIITDGNGCLKDTSFVLDEALTPQIDALPEQESCDIFTLPEITGTNLSGNEAYYSLSGAQGDTYLADASITESCSIFVFDSLSYCIDEYALPIIIHDSPELIDFSGEATYCEGNEIQELILNVDGIPEFTIEYTLDGILQTLSSNNSSFSIGNAPGLYTLLQLEDAFCGSSISAIQSIVINEIPSAPILEGETEYCESDFIEELLAFGGSGEVTWYEDSLLTEVVSSSNSYSPEGDLGSVSYYATYTENNCESIPSQIILTVAYCDVIVPTAFTPNNDNVNDLWNIKRLDLVFPKNLVSVYNRLGNKVYESTQGNYEIRPWDGIYDGNELPVGSYYYIIDYNDTSHKKMNGIVSIIR